MRSPLQGWFDRKHPLPDRFSKENHTDEPSTDWSVWLSIEETQPLHLAPKMQWIGFKEARQLTNDYLFEAELILRGLDDPWLDGEDQLALKEELGEPPKPCLPIYLITCKEAEKEEVVYIGKTKNTSRFTGGHAAALKLHSPKYKNKDKFLYRASIWFHFDSEYVSLDWIQPESLALRILDSIESQLIYHFQPELNSHKKKKGLASWKFSIHSQNLLPGGFLHDCFI